MWIVESHAGSEFTAAINDNAFFCFGGRYETAGKRKKGLLEFYAWASWGAAVLRPYTRCARDVLARGL
jgi:hypothetical protein